MLSFKTNLSLLLLSYLFAVIAADDGMAGVGGLFDTLLSFVDPLTESFEKAQEECGSDGISGCTIMTTLREMAFMAVGTFLGGGDDGDSSAGAEAAAGTTTTDAGTV